MKILAVQWLTLSDRSPVVAEGEERYRWDVTNLELFDTFGLISKQTRTGAVSGDEQ